MVTRYIQVVKLCVSDKSIVVDCDKRLDVSNEDDDLILVVSDEESGDTDGNDPLGHATVFSDTIITNSDVIISNGDITTTADDAGGELFFDDLDDTQLYDSYHVDTYTNKQVNICIVHLIVTIPL